MDYKKALSYVEDSSYGHSINFDNLKYALEILNINENDFKIIQIAGTNGKGTVGTFLSYFIALDNKKIGHFSSPHLEDYRERFKINNSIVNKDIFVESVKHIKDSLSTELKSKLTYFEISFIVALNIFKKKNVEYIIIEAGIGGRFDITNLFDNNILSIITTIGFDHVNALGNSLEDIAYHKAGIIKRNSRVVSFKHVSKVDDILIKESILKNSSIFFLDNKDVEIISLDINGASFKYNGIIFKTPMIGKHQGYNISLALMAYKLLNLTENIDKIKYMINNIQFEGRMEIIFNKPITIVDGAHNSEGLDNLNNNLKLMNIENYILVVGSMKDKDITENIDNLIEKAKQIIITKIDYDRAIEPEEFIKRLNLRSKKYYIITDIEELREFIIKNFTKEIVIITGSLYLVGEIKKVFKSF